MVTENTSNNGFEGGIDPGMLQQMSGAEGFPDPMGDMFMMGQGEQHRGLIREMLSAGDTDDERMVRLRPETKDVADWLDFEYEESFVQNRGRPDTQQLMKAEQLLGISLYGEARHEAVQMFTRIMTQFTGPGKWQLAAQRAFTRKPRQGPEQG